MLAGIPGGTGFGGVIKGDGVEKFPGDLLAAVEDRLDGGAADEVGQAADHPAGAAVQVLLQPSQGAGLVAVQPQRVFKGGDQALPLGGEREREGGDASESLASDTDCPVSVDLT